MVNTTNKICSVLILALTLTSCLSATHTRSSNLSATFEQANIPLADGQFVCEKETTPSANDCARNSKTAEENNTTAVLQGMKFDAASISAEDQLQFEKTLTLLYNNARGFYDRIDEIKPITLFRVDTAKGGIGRNAVTKPDTEPGHSGQFIIIFGAHPGKNGDGTPLDLDQQMNFLGVLVHETTHVIDLRDKRFPPKTSPRSCRVIEESGLNEQLRVKTELAETLQQDDLVRVLNEQIVSEKSDLISRSFWEAYCGIPEDYIQ